MDNLPHDKPENEVFLQIPMLPNMELAATETAHRIAEFMQFDPNKIDEIKISLIEGILNAFEHSQSKDKMVYIKFLMRDDELEVTIQDYGIGFSISNVNTKIEPLQYRGYGLTLISNLMDRVDVTSGPDGTKVVMSKRRHS
ncbi:MAG TPA: ATP-binding protein [Acidobacteriota bacterium]|nr:ATP-binding protein [Acidobacteriota bacterium]HNB71359.1 ATP-binding protein [Acidobacteriota bacterium]HNC43426.1 ATP-binding protein [Acidobacteriota bacterium]HND20926.1 ATP-binding protein [Acidobacteriota bacterium]HNG91335.1 ATP-binding protein [Acidobacteriota bacterium]